MPLSSRNVHQIYHPEHVLVIAVVTMNESRTFTASPPPVNHPPQYPLADIPLCAVAVDHYLLKLSWT